MFITWQVCRSRLTKAVVMTSSPASNSGQSFTGLLVVIRSCPAGSGTKRPGGRVGLRTA